MINLNYIKLFNFRSKKSYHNCDKFFETGFSILYDPEKFVPFYGLINEFFRQVKTKKINTIEYDQFYENNPKLGYICMRSYPIL